MQHFVIATVTKRNGEIVSDVTYRLEQEYKRQLSLRWPNATEITAYPPQLVIHGEDYILTTLVDVKLPHLSQM